MRKLAYIFGIALFLFGLPLMTSSGFSFGVASAFKGKVKRTIHPSPPVPDVLPDASNICTLLIKLGLTFKKVC